MGNKAWGILLAIFIFSSLTVTVNDLGVFDQKGYIVGSSTNSSAIDDSTDAIKEITTDDINSEGDLRDEVPDYGGITIFFKLVSLIIQALGMLILIAPTLIDYGVPTSIAVMIQGVISLTEAAFIVSVWRKYKVG